MRSSFRAETRNPVEIVIANSYPCEAIPVSIKAMFFTTEENEDTERIFKSGERGSYKGD